MRWSTHGFSASVSYCPIEANILKERTMQESEMSTTSPAEDLQQTRERIAAIVQDEMNRSQGKGVRSNDARIDALELRLDSLKLALDRLEAKIDDLLTPVPDE